MKSVQSIIICISNSTCRLSFNFGHLVVSEHFCAENSIISQFTVVAHLGVWMTDNAEENTELLMLPASANKRGNV